MVANTVQIDLAGERVGAIYGTAFFAAAEASSKTAEAIEELDDAVIVLPAEGARCIVHRGIRTLDVASR